MWRYFTGFSIALFECLLLAWPPCAHASFDLFSTGKYVASGPFARTSEVCPKDRILSPLTLADVVELSLCNNPQTQSLWASSRIQAAQLGSSMSAYLPTLSGPISVSGSRNNNAGPTSSSKSIGVTISYLLYDFGGRAANIENARQLLVAANATRDEALQTVYLSAVQAYYTLLSTRATVESLRAAEVAARESLKAAQARYHAGAATPADSLQAQTALSQATLNRIRAEGDAASAQGALLNIMGFDVTQHFELAPVPDSTPNPVAEQAIGELIATARRNRPDLVAAEAQIKAAEASLAATKAAGLPSISLNGDLSKIQTRTSGINSSNYGQSLGVSISVPWFSGYRDTYNNRAAQAQLEGKVADRDRMANQIALDVWKAYQALLTNSAALGAADDLLASAKQSEKMASGRYKAGLGNILDMLTAQSALTSAEQQRVAALYNYQASRFALAQAMGQLDLTRLSAK